MKRELEFASHPGNLSLMRDFVREFLQGVEIASIEKDFAWVPDHPVAEAYRCYKPMPYDRPSWDLTAVLYAVRPGQHYFSLPPPGRVTVDANGQTIFNPTADGKHRYLILGNDQKTRTLEALILLASQPRSHP